MVKCFGFLFSRRQLSDLPKYLHKRKQGFYAILEIPRTLRDVLGKPRFIQSLKTKEQKLAERRLPIVITRWQAAIETARGKQTPTSSIAWEVLEWRKALAEAPEDEGKDALESLLKERLEALEQSHGEDAAQEAATVVFGSAIVLTEQLPGWLKTLHRLNDKTADAQKKRVTEFCKTFRTSNAITKPKVKEYIEKLRVDDKLQDRTIKARISFIRSFISYIDQEHGTEYLDFFSSRTMGKPSGKTEKQRAWLPFSPAEVSQLYAAALATSSRSGQSAVLADLIALGAYTGCRIEELGQLTRATVSDESFTLLDSKTAAGIRVVPIHPIIKPLVKRLLDQSEDNFLVTASEATYGKRTNALGTRFGRLKRSLGFDDRHVFHSIRKTVVSQLERAGVEENVSADIVGHDKPRITYGLYSGGTSMEQKLVAIKMVKYPGNLSAPV